ncbi:MAG: outer membrane beta-barrel protein [Candidatus Hydrogenedentota bacterium]
MSKGIMKVACLSVLALLATAQTASAQLDDIWYLGISGGEALEDWDDGGFLDADDSTVLGAQIGFTFRDESFFGFQFEFKYRDYDGFDYGSGANTSELDGWSVSARPKLYMGNGKIHPILFVGLGWMEMDAKSNFSAPDLSGKDTFFEVGGALEFDVTERVSLFIEAGYVIPDDHLDGLEMIDVMGGINFKF